MARLFGVALALLATVAVDRPVQAHTGFDYSVPTDGASVGTPLTEVTVAFTLPVTLVGSGFEVLDPQGNVRLPFAVTDDDTIFRLQFDPPLAGGAVGVRYEVLAEDGHTLSGSFSFTVSVPLPASTTAAPTSTAPVPATTAPGVSTTTPAAATTAPVSTAIAVTTVSPVATTDPTQVTVAVTGSGTESGDQSNSGLFIGIAAGVAVLAAVFLAVRARTAGIS
jgi:copper transport protein